MCVQSGRILSLGMMYPLYFDLEMAAARSPLSAINTAAARLPALSPLQPTCPIFLVTPSPTCRAAIGGKSRAAEGGRDKQSPDGWAQLHACASGGRFGLDCRAQKEASCTGGRFISRTKKMERERPHWFGIKGREEVEGNDIIYWLHWC